MWAGVDAVTNDLPRGIPAFLNISNLKLKTNEMELCLAHYPLMYYRLTEEGEGIYFFHVLLTAENADPVKTLVIRLTWNKAQATLAVEMDTPQKK